MNQSRARMATYAPGTLLLLTLMMGGGTQTSLLTDAIIQIVTIFVCVGLLLTKQSTRMDWRLLAFPLLAIVVVCLQLAPLPVGWVERVWPPAVLDAWRLAGDGASLGFATLNVASTLQSLAMVLVATLLLWALASLAPEQLRALVPFVAIGVMANVFAFFLQVAMGRTEPIENVLSYPISAGFFANHNHLASLLLMVIPPLVYLVARGWRVPGAIVLAIVLLALLAIGSRAGVVVGVAATAVSFALLSDFASRRPAAIAAGVAACLVLAGIGWRNVSLRGADVNAGRLEFLATSVNAIRETPILGAGFGTFAQTYQIYEKASDITTEYVNHAHDDYLELVVEGGALAGVMIVLYFALMVSRVAAVFRRPLARVALLSILVVLIHSGADYPLRTMAVLYMFLYAHAVLFMDMSEAENRVAALDWLAAANYASIRYFESRRALARTLRR